MSDWSFDTNTMNGGASSQTTLFQRGRQVYRVATWTNWLLSWLGSKTGIATVIGATGLGGAAAVGVLAPELIGLAPPKLTQVKTETWGGSSVVFPVRGRDATGRAVTFDILALSQDLSWVRGSERELQRGAQVLAETDVVRDVLDDGVRRGLSASGEVIAVGVASIEGEASAEVDRANRRATVAAGWLEKALAPNVAISTLNFGQFRQSCVGTIEGGTAWQRPLLIIGVRERDVGADLAQAFANALEGKSNLPSPSCYTQLALARHR